MKRDETESTLPHGKGDENKKRGLQFQILRKR